MTQPSGQTTDPFARKVSSVLGELAKGMKTVRQYPPGHPSLLGAMARVTALLEQLPLPQDGLEIGVTKGALLLSGTPLPSPSIAVGDLHRELYLRRAARLILQPGVTAPELSSFLSVLALEPREVQEKGGLEKLLLDARSNHVWVNRVDYEGLMEMLKRDEQKRKEEEEEAAAEEEGEEGESEEEEEDRNRPPVERLLARLARETHPEAYVSLADSFLALLVEEPRDRKLRLSVDGCALFLRHHGEPPAGEGAIAARALEAIRSLATDEVAEHVLRTMNDRGDQSRREGEGILVLMGERVVPCLLQALGHEEDLAIRKSIVEAIARIGHPAAPAVRHHFQTVLRGRGEWYSLRNALTIMGRLAFPDFTRDIADAFVNEGDERFRDPRVRREAIRALGRIPDPDALSFLAALTFDPDEGTRLAATAALGMKRESDAVEALYRRATARSGFLSPDYRLAHEAIDALRTIGTSEALARLEQLLSYRPAFFIPWETKGSREMKFRVLHCLSRMEGKDAKECLLRVAATGRGALKEEAERLARRTARG